MDRKIQIESSNGSNHFSYNLQKQQFISQPSIHDDDGNRYQT